MFRHGVWIALAAVALASCQKPEPKVGPALAWAYPVAPETPLPVTPPGQHHVPGSPIVFSKAELDDRQIEPDWFPNEHPPAPAVIGRTRKGGPEACAECHFYSGGGFIGAPDLAGLPAAYIVEQIRAFRSGERRSAEKGWRDQVEMTAVAKRVTDDEAKAAAAYYAAVPRRARYRVAETANAPAAHPVSWGWMELTPGAPAEPTQGRVVEVAEDFAEMTLSDPHTGIIDYASPGSVARGAALAKRGGPNGQPCMNCHGQDLKGRGDVPPLAGRSAAYLARQLWDIHTGARQGASVAQMQGPARALDEAQITDLSAYLASLKP